MNPNRLIFGEEKNNLPERTQWQECWRHVGKSCLGMIVG